MSLRQRLIVLHWSYLEFDTRLHQHVRELSESFDVTVFGPDSGSSDPFGPAVEYVRAVTYEDGVGTEPADDFARFMERYRRIVVKDREEVAGRRTGGSAGLLGRLDARSIRVARSDHRFTDLVWRQRFRPAIDVDDRPAPVVRRAAPSFESVVGHSSSDLATAVLVHDDEWLAAGDIEGLASSVIVDRDLRTSVEAGGSTVAAGPELTGQHLVEPVVQATNGTGCRELGRRIIVIVPACLDTHGATGVFDTIDQVLRFDASFVVAAVAPVTLGDRFESAVTERFDAADRERITVQNEINTGEAIGVVAVGNGARSGVRCHSCSGAHGARALQDGVSVLVLPDHLGGPVEHSYEPGDLPTIARVLGRVVTRWMIGDAPPARSSGSTLTSLMVGAGAS